MSAEPARLHPEDLEALADLVAERVTAALRDRPPADRAELVDAAEIARRFHVSRDTVYALADELGAIRLGDGPRPRLRFDAERVAAALAERASTTLRSSEQKPPAARPRRRRPAGADVDLLPIKGGRR